MTLTLTHKGWFGVCPVYLADLDSDAPLVVERHWALVPLMLLSEACFGALFVLGSLFAGFEPAWPISVTGELDTPVTIDVDDEEAAP
ncbi:MAG: hypothetical protein IAE86_06845 [Burkholderiaceae bacterium]|nr:hypothetical protein [Burkholderiaceae bacterium]